VSDQPAETTPAPDAPLAQRVDGLEVEQKRQGGVLDRIENLLTTSGDTVTSADQPPAAAAADMGEQMRQAVRDVRAEEAAAAPAPPPPETTPREVMIRGKDKLQRALFGSDPEAK
jgi:hypothetical protein